MSSSTYELHSSTRPVEGFGIAEEGKYTSMILVMGVTGAGKSYFINKLVGKPVANTSDRLNSCTSTCQAVLTQIGKTKTILVDTPGFDDTTKSDTEILDDIARLLAAQYQLGVSLKGIVFLHRISDSRFSGTAGKTLNMFQKLCGKGALSNVILVTTRWSEIDESLGAVREKDLRNQFWTFMLNCGSTMARFLGDRDSALGIVSQLLGKSNVVLDIQRELVDEHKQLHETSAGAVVDDELAMLKQKATEELEQIEELRRSLQDSDSRMRDDMQRRWLEEQRRVKDADEMEKRLRRDISKEVREDIGKGVKKQRYRGIFPTILGVLGMFVGLDYSIGSGLVDGLQSLMDLY